MSSKKLFKIIAIIAAILLLLSVLLSALFVHLYQDEIKAYSITQINKQLDAKVEVKNISLSLWSQFPRASLHFEAVKIITQNAEKTKNYEAISANSIYLSFNIWDLIDHNYKLQQVILKGARLNLLIEENGSHNMHFIKETNSDSSQFFLNLNLVRFKNSKFHYINHATHQELEIDIENLKLGGIFQNDSLMSILKHKLIYFISKPLTITLLPIIVSTYPLDFPLISNIRAMSLVRLIFYFKVLIWIWMANLKCWNRALLLKQI